MPNGTEAMTDNYPTAFALLPTIAGGILSVLVAFPALADPNLNCDAYAKAAVAEQQQNLQLGCGLTGLPWQDNFQAHFNWCQSPGVDIMAVSNADQFRLGALAQCKQAKSQSPARPANAPTERACNNYRDLMIGLSKENTQFKCGYTDSRFDNNPQGHFNWCWNGPTHKEVEATYEYTLQLVDQCKASKKAAGACGLFAVAMGPLYNQYNEACAGRPDFVLTISTAQQDKELCAANGADAGWINKTVGEMQAKIDVCNSNAAVELPKDKYRVRGRGNTWLYFDVCNMKDKWDAGDGALFGLRCHKAQADALCRRNGFAGGAAGGRGVGFDYKSNDQSASDFGVSADGASTWWPEEGNGRPCYGNCAHFTKIICKGKG